MEREKEQMMREKEELMLRLQDYEEKTRKAEKGGRGLLGGGALVRLRWERGMVGTQAARRDPSPLSSHPKQRLSEET